MLLKDFFVYEKEIQMGGIALMLEGAILNATAFTGVGYLAKYLASDNSSCWGEEAALSRRWKIYQVAYEKYQEALNKASRLDSDYWSREKSCWADVWKHGLRFETL